MGAGIGPGGTTFVTGLIETSVSSVSLGKRSMRGVIPVIHRSESIKIWYENSMNQGGITVFYEI